MTNLENLKQIKASFETLSKEYKEIKGQMEKMDMPKEDMMMKMSEMQQNMMDRMQRMSENMYNYVGYLEKAFYEHSDSRHHLPPVQGAEQMQHCLDVLGLAGNFEVKKQTIYANTKRGLVVEAAYSKES